MEPANDDTVVPFTAPALYDSLWSRVEACSHLSGDFQRIHWFVAGRATPNAAWSIPCPSQVSCAGYWIAPDTIVLARWYALYDEASHFRTVRHEMLHDLLQGDAEHQSPLWKVCQLD